MEKPFLTIEQQILKLRSQGLSITSNKHVIDFLCTHSYYSIVNGYCDLFVKSKMPRKFKEGSSFCELEALYNFDTGFARYLLKQILYIEDKIKATCISEFCGARKGKAFLYPRDAYLEVSSYSLTTEKKAKSVEKLIEDFKKAIETNIKNKNQSFVHAKTNYGYIPFWILASNLTFGQLSKFYECLKFDIRERIANKFGLEQKELRVALKILNQIRNLCAHSNRVFNAYIPFVFSSQIGVNGKIFKIDPSANFKFGSVLIAIKFLVNTDRFHEITKHLGGYLLGLEKKLKIVSIKDVLRNMGISPQMNKDMKIIRLT